MKTIESFVYIKSQQGKSLIDKVVDEINLLDGVMAANVNKNIAGVINIHHDPVRVASGKIIDHLKMNGYSSYQFGF